MSEPSNDRLEQFFRKAATRADVTFNEDDWKKLEARLDASDAAKGAGTKKSTKLTATIIAGIMLVGTSLWLGFHSDIFSSGNESIEKGKTGQISQPDRGSSDIDADKNAAIIEKAQAVEESEEEKAQVVQPATTKRNAATTGARSSLRPMEIPVTPSVDGIVGGVSQETTISLAGNNEKSMEGSHALPLLPSEKIRRDLVRTSIVRPQQYKQKAVVELPGAEEEKTREVGAIVEEELASDQTKKMATPRLSLLLSFAPDFSGTSLGQYSAPGTALGAMIHYHPFNQWSIAAGVVQNKKQYTGDGEDYKPPKGYWKYYTNGIIPETVDGSCSILEFPLMIQYTIRNGAKSRWLIGAGTSSYLMQSESYEYYFDQPNPGAKERWDSRGSSRFLFNMVNFSIGYERQVLPGLTLGLEPYAKIPLEEIGWSNLRLFSTGASVTLRYTVLRRDKLTIPAKRRAPDG